MSKPNILFLVIDSLRHDKCLGVEKSSKTPNLDSIIENGIFFQQAISPSPITVPSLSSIFTGLYPYECTNLKNDIFTLNERIPTLIELFEKNDYSTHAIIPEALNYTNIPKNFQNIETFNSFATLYDGLGEKIVKKLQNLLNQEPWFLYIHLEDLHGNALFHLSSDKNDIDTFVGKNQYAKMLSAIDPWLGKIFENIDEENTLIIITSDHGSTSADFTDEMLDFVLDNEKIKSSNESLVFKLGHKLFTSLPKTFKPIRKKIADTYVENKKKKIQNKLKPNLSNIDKLKPNKYQERLLKKSVVYPSSCFDENFRPALIFYGYEINKNQILTEQISTMNILPTILDMLKIQIPNKISGKSFFPLLENKSIKEHPILIDSTSDNTRAKFGDTIGMRTAKYKYFRNRSNPKNDVNLYDLINDPMELENISESHPDLIQGFENELKKIEPNGIFNFKNKQNLSKDDTQKAKDILKEMGYLK